MCSDNGISDSLPVLGKTHKSIEEDLVCLTIPNHIIKELGIENSRVSISLLYDYGDGKHLLISKFHREIILD